MAGVVPITPACSQSRACDALSLQIGAVAVSLHADLPDIRQEFAELYAAFPECDAESHPFRIDVRRRRSPRSLRRHYHIVGNDEPLFTVQSTDAVMPHIEWAVNSLVARYLPHYFQIHASVLSRDGVGVLFPGTPGSGKSTLAAALVKRGWSYLSDEFALIDPETLTLAPYPKALCIKAGSFSVLQRIGIDVSARPGYRKGRKGRVALLNPLSIRPDAVGDACTLGGVIFPTYDRRETPELAPMSRARALFELTQTAFNFSKFRHEGIDLLGDALQDVKCYRLTSGKLTACCDAIERALFAREMRAAS